MTSNRLLVIIAQDRDMEICPAFYRTVQTR